MTEIEYAGILASSLGVYATKYPTIPAPIERINEIEIPGRSGKLHERTGKYEETEIPIEFNFTSKKDCWDDTCEEIKKWLSRMNDKLIIGESNTYYKVQLVYLDGIERLSDRIGKIKANFVTKDGLRYMEVGEIEAIKNRVYNPGICSEPIYLISGEGLCTITVNGKTVRANVGQNLTIDTERMLSYRNDGTLQNTDISGNYEDLYLQPGENQISITDGFKLKIIPNWRHL